MSLWEIVLGSGGGLIILLTLIQISPIKINPWSSFARAIGKAINADLAIKLEQTTSRLDKIEDKLNETIEKEEEREIKQARSRILNFANEMMLGVRHTKDMFDEVLLDCDDYEKYCEEHKSFRNSIAEESINCIREAYHYCREKRAFLSYAQGSSLIHEMRRIYDEQNEKRMV